MNWIRIYNEVKDSDSTTFQVLDGIPTRFEPNKEIMQRCYTLSDIKVKAFDQIIEKFDGFSSDELRMIFESLRHPMNQHQDNKELTDKVWSMFNLKESLKAL